MGARLGRYDARARDLRAAAQAAAMRRVGRALLLGFTLPAALVRRRVVTVIACRQ